jgi:hypothetical protein
MGWRHWGMAIVVAFALAAPAGAQTLDPTSSRNVAPSVGTAGLAAVEARRKLLFEQMLRDPANLDIAFEYAALSVQAGDLESAISTLERMLIFAPGLARLQFELGVLYYRLEAYDTSATYFRTVAANPAVPPEVLSQVGAYLDAIERGGQGQAMMAVLTTGIRWQSNANAGPSDPTVLLNGLPFVLNAGAMQTPDINMYGTATLNGSVDLRRQGATFDLSLAAYGALYRNQTAFNTGVVEMRVGPTFSLQRFEMDNATIGIYGVASAAILGGSLYQGALGLGKRFRVALDSSSVVTLTLEGRKELYLNSPDRPAVSVGSGERYTASATFERELTPALMAFLTLTGERRLARAGYLSHWKAAATAGLAITFDSLIAAIDGKWTLAFSAGVRHQKNDQPDPVFSATNPKVTTQGFAEARLSVPVGDNFALESAVSYTVSRSNYGLDVYNNATASVGLSKGF